MTDDQQIDDAETVRDGIHVPDEAGDYGADDYERGMHRAWGER